MTILICIPCLLTGGTEIQTLNLVQALVAGGHQVVTTCYFEYSDDMVVRFRKAGSEVVCLSPTGTRVNGWRGILFLYKGLRSINPMWLMCNIWLRVLFLSCCCDG